MIIQAVRKISRDNVPRFCWRQLAQFQNIGQTAEAIIKLHGLKPDQFDNARNQAREIKSCLAQAREYYDAAASVSLATQPVLLYYAVMSMALAEILFKQSGDSRLAMLRAEHNCHGLDFRVTGKVTPKQTLTQVARLLVAKAQVMADGPRGTFEVWRRSHREFPVSGVMMTIFPNMTTSETFQILLGAADEPPKRLPPRGVSLLDCVAPLPYLSDSLSHRGAGIDTVRAIIVARKEPNAENPTTSIIIQPTPEDVLDRLNERVICAPASVNGVEFREVTQGYAIDLLPVRFKESMYFPQAICMSDRHIHFNCGDLDYGEFGLLYLALHICGNFSRYYPDLWLRQIEENSPLALTIEELCSHAFERLPLLVLSELSRTYHVLES